MHSDVFSLFLPKTAELFCVDNILHYEHIDTFDVW